MPKESPYLESNINSDSKENPVKVKTKERTPQEVQILKERLHFVAKVLSKNFNMAFIPDRPPPGKSPNWRAGLSEKFFEERKKYPEKNLEDFDEKLLIPEVMKYPEQELAERSEDYIWGIFRHEMGHIKHSDYRSLMEIQEKVKGEGYNPLDAFMVYDAWEDGRSNACEAKTSKAARHRIGTYLEEDVAGALLIEFEKKPLPIQYGLLCWAKGAEPFISDFDFEEIKAKTSDERVLDAYKKTEEILAEYLREPKGRKAFTEILWPKAWPVFKELIDKYIEEEGENLHNESKKGEEGAQQIQKPQESAEESEDGSEKNKSEEKESSWDSLSEEEKKEWREQARQKLDDEERKAVDILQPKSMPIEEKEDGTIEVKIQQAAPEDKERIVSEELANKIKEQEKRRATEEAKKEASAGLKESLIKLKELQTGLSENKQTEYRQFLNPVRKYIGLLEERLDEVFPPREITGWEGSKRRGKRLERKNLAREIPIKSGKFFESKNIPEIREIAFTLLNDVSGSMKGPSIENDMKAKVMVAEAFAKKGIPFEILAFHGGIIEVKKFDDPYDGKTKLRLLEMAKEVRQEGSYNTDTGFALDWASRRLQKRLLEYNASGALVVLTDGRPEPIGEHSGPEWELHAIVNKWSKRIPLIGIGIGSGMEKDIKDYFGKNALSVPDVTKLPLALLRTLKKQIDRLESKW